MEITKKEIIEDISNLQARENYDKMVDYLVSLPVYNYQDYVSFTSLEKNIKCKKGLFPLLLDDSMNYIFFDENLKKAKHIINNKISFEDSKIINGFAKIYDLNSEVLLSMKIDNSFVSIAAIIHELTHLIQAINKNNPTKRYNEILSIFSEFVILDYLSSKFDNPDIFDNHLINRIINRMSYRVYSNQLLHNESKLLENIYLSCYTYFIGMIYAIRLFTLYKNGDLTILSNFNNVLNGNITIDKLLEKYCINMSNQDTINSFTSWCDYYQEIVTDRYGSNVHYVK